MVESTDAKGLAMRQHRTRDRFILSFFVVGTILPLAVMTYGWVTGTATGEEREYGHTGTAQWALLWISWPTWILMLDAEHPGTIAFMLTIAAVLNGLWYAGIAFIFWYVGAGLKRFR